MSVDDNISITSDFWLDTEKYDDYIFKYIDKPSTKSVKADEDLKFSVDLIYLSSARKAISNFVSILTNKRIPVYFRENGNPSMAIDGKSVYISTKILKKSDFDVAVGLSLHEGSHILKTDFDMAKVMWASIPTWIWDFADKHKIRRSTIEKFVLWIWNIIEDRYIDNYIFNSAPGYRGYYKALYDTYFNSKFIDDGLKGPLYRYPSLKSYKFRITNITNELTDLDALPGLREIAEIIDLSNIDRLQTTGDRIKLTYKVIEIIFKHLEKEQLKDLDDKKGGDCGKNNVFNPRDLLEDDVEPSKEEEPSKSESEMVVKEIAGLIGKKNVNIEQENKDIVENIGPEESKDLSKAIERQKEFIYGQIEKFTLTPKQKQILDLIEKHGIVLVKVGENLLAGNNVCTSVDCIVVNKMSRELVLSGSDVFPLSSFWKDEHGNIKPNIESEKAVLEGISLGKSLGRKLRIRNEVNPVKSIRKRSGKIYKRRLFAAGMNEEDIFELTSILKYNKASLHITVDASTSMVGKKWYQTLKSCVAICKATSIVSDIHVTVSFRTTQSSSKHSFQSLPYVVMAYDSKKDKFSKIRNLFPYLNPNGNTPEGLAFEAIMKLFENTSPDEEERYFLNLSDGEPYFRFHIEETNMDMNYTGEIAVKHTKEQVDKIRRSGAMIMSYFINNAGDVSLVSEEKNSLSKDFHKMYGKDAKFIDVESISDLAHTMNGLFLKSEEKRS